MTLYNEIGTNIYVREIVIYIAFHILFHVDFVLLLLLKAIKVELNRNMEQ